MKKHPKYMKLLGEGLVERLALKATLEICMT